MSKKFLLPDLGEGLPDATIVEWYVKEGDVIRLDENLVSMETAKAVVDVPSPVSGKVLKLAGGAGDVIVRGAQRVGRIIFHQGKVAWAHVSDIPGSLATILADEPGITRDDIHELIEECGASGANFADILLRAYTKSPPRAIFLALGRTTTTLGMARRALTECLGE